MNKLLRSLLVTVFFALATLPGLGRASSGDYLSLQVPDLRQAVSFFQDVMNCSLLSANIGTGKHAPAMLDCGDGSMVELVVRSGPSHASSTVIFVTDNAVKAAAWLRANHVAIVGQPVRTAEGMRMDNVVVDFVAPWGQPMQLVSHAAPDATDTATRLAVQ
ncbi:MAG: VOC family protein [Rhodanobacter sp.]